MLTLGIQWIFDKHVLGIMDRSLVITEIKKMWKEVFHDTDKYIDLFFSSYVNKSFLIFATHDTNIVASLMSVPYTAICNIDGSNQCSRCALYLCGLMTDPLFRSKGIMSRLLNMSGVLSEKISADFEFLIPSDNRNRDYYQCRGFVNSFDYDEVKLYRDMFADIDNNVSDIQYIRTENDRKIFDSVCDLFVSYECGLQGFLISHSHYDYSIICKDCVGDGGVVVSCVVDDIVKGAAIVSIAEGKVLVKYLAAYSDMIAMRLIRDIFNSFGTDIVILRVFPGQYFLFLDTIIRNYPETKVTVKYGMSRCLRNHENLKFTDNSSSSFKFSILAPSMDTSVLCSDFFHFNRYSCFKNLWRVPGGGGYCGTENIKSSLFLMLD